MSKGEMLINKERTRKEKKSSLRIEGAHALVVLANKQITLGRGFLLAGKAFNAFMNVAGRN